MGLPPTYHRECIDGIHAEAYYRYLVDRMQGAARTSAIHAQLDLLFEFVQYELLRRRPGEQRLTLYRGVNDFEEHRVLETLGRNHYLLELNNLNSFTDDFERAWEFGSRVLKVEAPVYKVFFQGGLLPSVLLKGEGEVMLIGGRFEARVLSGG